MYTCLYISTNIPLSGGINVCSVNVDPVCLIRLERCGNHADVVLIGCDRTCSVSGPGRKNFDEGELNELLPTFQLS